MPRTRRPAYVEVQLTPENGAEVWEWAESKPHYAPGGVVDGLTIYAPEGRVVAAFGDWVVEFPRGEFRVERRRTQAAGDPA